MSKNKIFSIKQLGKFNQSGPSYFKSLNNINIELEPGEVVGIMGLNGSGKSTLAQSIMRQVNNVEGDVFFGDQLISGNKITKDNNRLFRKNVQMIFSDPNNSLNEKKRVIDILSEPLKIHKFSKEKVDDILSDWPIITKNFTLQFKEEFLKEMNTYIKLENELSHQTVEKIKDELSEFDAKNFTNSYTAVSYLASIYFRPMKKMHQDQVAHLNKTENSIYDLYFEKQKKARSNNLPSQELDLLRNYRKLDAHEKLMYTAKNFGKVIRKLEHTQNKKLSDNFSTTKLAMSSYLSQFKHRLKVEKSLSYTVKDKYEYLEKAILISKQVALTKNVKIIKREKTFLTSIQTRDLVKSVVNHVEKITHELSKIINEKNYIEKCKEIEDISWTDKSYIQDSIKNISAVKVKYSDEIFKLNQERHEGKYKFSQSRLYVLRHNVREAEITFQKYNSENRVAWSAQYDNLIETHDMIIANLTNSTLKRKYKTIEKKFKEIQNSIYAEFKKKESKEKTKESFEWLNNHIKESKIRIQTQKYEIEKLENTIDNYQRFLAINNMKFRSPEREITKIINEKMIFETMKLLGLKPDQVNRYPYEFSAGQKQRIAIARALVVEPKVLISDEILDFLDVSTQSRIINLLLDIIKKKNIAMIFFSKDFSKMKFLASKLYVMSKGEIVEYGTTTDIISKSIHPYTKIMFDSISKLSNAGDNYKIFDNIYSYATAYTPKNLPTIHEITKTHYVLSTDDQLKEWKLGSKKIT